MALAEEPPGHLRLRVDDVAELDLLLAKLLLVLLQPRLVVLYEQVDGVALGQEGRPGARVGLTIIDCSRRYLREKQ